MLLLELQLKLSDQTLVGVNLLPVEEKYGLKGYTVLRHFREEGFGEAMSL